MASDAPQKVEHGAILQGVVDEVALTLTGENPLVLENAKLLAHDRLLDTARLDDLSDIAATGMLQKVQDTEAEGMRDDPNYRGRCIEDVLFDKFVVHDVKRYRNTILKQHYFYIRMYLMEQPEI